MPYESGRGTDRRTFVKLAAGTMLASGLGLRAYADGSPDGPNQKKVYPDRWVYVSRSFDTDKDVEEIRQLARALRVFRLYSGNNPVVLNARASFRAA